MTDLDQLKAELQWCIANASGPRTEAALLWALELVAELEAEHPCTS